jgi:hypothetical protein
MKYLVITIDVEPDCSPTWHYSNPLTFEGVRVGIKEKLQPLFNRYGFPPTYLLNNVVMEDSRSVEALRNLEGRFELGTHLHSEFIEPEKRFAQYAGVKAQMNQTDFSLETERAKLQNITDLYITCFGRRPFSFRAGRFSARAHTIRCLWELGYKVDTSVVPNITWQDNTQHGPDDYSQAPEQPYFVADTSLIKRDSTGTILEVPVTICKKHRFLRRPKLTWLRPIYSDFIQMQKITKQVCKRYLLNGNIVLNMMFHNVEVLPGRSPYVQTDEESQNYLKLLETFLNFARNSGIRGITLSELYDVYNLSRK